MEFRQTPVFHTFFLPKRERKYQRKRFRAAARTPRGHRSCSALSALEMRRRLQRCYCNAQNEALAPLPGRKTYVFGCSRDIPPKTPEGKRVVAVLPRQALTKAPSQTPKLPRTRWALTSLAWFLFLMATPLKIEEKGLCFAVAKPLCLLLREMETSGILIY